MEQSLWHPRIVPFLVYVLLLTVVGFARDAALWSYPITYAVQCGIIVWLIVRYRRLMPEFTLSFHWLAVPTAVIVVAVWIALGKAMVHLWPERFASDEPHYFDQMSPGLMWLSVSLRLLGMSLVVPLLEEPFVRSLLLRATAHVRPTFAAMVQFGQDLPIIGDTVMDSRVGRWADAQGDTMQREFDTNPLGTVTVFGVVLSTLVFSSYHGMRDWPACVFCGITWCLLVAVTAKKGLGPVIWSHGLTNALLMAYAIYTRDWQFM